MAQRSGTTPAAQMIMRSRMMSNLSIFLMVHPTLQRSLGRIWLAPEERVATIVVSSNELGESVEQCQPVGKSVESILQQAWRDSMSQNWRESWLAASHQAEPVEEALPSARVGVCHRLTRSAICEHCLGRQQWRPPLRK
mmetsp:Transcript_28177/g.59981  ORF Transcript_28177/g.59981 Transcript_28177/m.59981 type:complete len:139 (+) Transcript_28177:317-733(+)